MQANQNLGHRDSSSAHATSNDNHRTSSTAEGGSSDNTYDHYGNNGSSSSSAISLVGTGIDSDGVSFASQSYAEAEAAPTSFVVGSAVRVATHSDFGSSQSSGSFRSSSSSGSSGSGEHSNYSSSHDGMHVLTPSVSSFGAADHSQFVSTTPGLAPGVSSSGNLIAHDSMELDVNSSTEASMGMKFLPLH